MQKIIESHDGRIWAENPINKKGDIFNFSLPLKNGHPEGNEFIDNKN